MIPDLKRLPSPITNLDTREPKKRCVQELNKQPVDLSFAINLINQWNFAAKNNINTSLRLKLCKNTLDTSEKLKQLKISCSIEQMGELCISILNKFNSFSTDDLRTLGEWIASNSSYAIDECGAYNYFTKFIQIFRDILSAPEVNNYIKKRQKIDLKYAEITETAITTINANRTGFPYDKDVINLININFDRRFQERDREAYLALTSTSRHHYNIRRSNLVDELHNSQHFRKYHLEELIKLLGEFSCKVRKISLKGFFFKKEDMRRVHIYFPFLESLSIKTRVNAGLNGLDKLSNLIDLDLDSSTIDSLDFLKSLSLKTLNLSHCTQIKNFKILESCVSLTSLDLSFTSIENLDFLKNLSSLKKLKIDKCEHLQIKEEHPNILSLDLRASKISVDILRYFPNLTALDLSLCLIDNIQNLKKYFKFGKVIYPNGNEFEGAFFENYKEGVLNCPAFKMEGRFLNEINGKENFFFQEDTLQGRGACTLPNGTRYEGEFINGKLVGETKILYTSGSIYVGPVLNKSRHGRGVHTLSNGTRYEGDFIDDKLVGVVKINYRDGSIYVGSVLCHIEIEYLNGMLIRDGSLNVIRQGQGGYTLPNGMCYEGEFVNDKLVGEVKIIYPSGTIYVGMIFKGLPHGKGTYFSFEGGRYEAEFINGKMVGEAKIKYPDESIYIGTVLNGLRHGRGVYIYANGDRYEGEFIKGSPANKVTDFSE